MKPYKSFLFLAAVLAFTAYPLLSVSQTLLPSRKLPKF